MVNIFTFVGFGWDDRPIGSLDPPLIPNHDKNAAKWTSAYR